VTKMKKIDRREMARGALRRAAGEDEPDVGRIVDVVPAMLAEARRRRVAESHVDAISAVVPLARRLIPGLAAAAALLVLVATFAGLQDTSSSVRGTAGFDGLVLTGEVSGDGSDVLLEAMTERRSDDG